MRSIAVMTATCNHPKELKTLYQSLLGQRDRDFSWVIVNDGSREETKELIQEFEAEKSLDIVAVHQPNSGKSRAINRGFDTLTEDVCFAVIVDDDECLKPEAVAEIRRAMDAYRETECRVIHFNRQDEKGGIIANPPIEKDFFMSYPRFKGEGRSADGYLGYFVHKMENRRFTIYPGEKYIAPSTLFMRVAGENGLLWSASVLGETEYLAGGITRQGRRLRVKNPCGMTEYCALIYSGAVGFKQRVAYSLQGYAYAHLAKNRAETAPWEKVFLPWMKPAGILLALYWKKKYPVQPASQGKK